jgi:hypothetical protein
MNTQGSRAAEQETRSKWDDYAFGTTWRAALAVQAGRARSSQPALCQWGEAYLPGVPTARNNHRCTDAAE